MTMFKTQNLRLLCMSAAIALFVPGGANAHVIGGGYEEHSCTPHAALFDTNAFCPAGAFSQCECKYVPEGGGDFTVCPGAGLNNTPPPAGTYFYHRLTTCGLGTGPSFDSLDVPHTAVAAGLGWTVNDLTPPYAPSFSAVPGKPSCGHVLAQTEYDGPIIHPLPVPFLGWSHDDCALPGTALVTKTQSMDGDLKVAQGSTLLAGFDFTMPGSHPAASIGFLGAKVVFDATCASGTPKNTTIVVDIPNQPFKVAENDSAWYPSGDQTSAATYQGSATVPAFCDPGTLVRLQKGGTFSTNVLSSDKENKVNIRWHYSDGTGGGWSGTYSVIGN